MVDHNIRKVLQWLKGYLKEKTMILNKQILEEYVGAGWLIKQSHPTLPLSIYNYSQHTQYEKHWDEVTLSCRGLITDDETGEVIVKPFNKFFNYEEVPFQTPWLSSDYVYIQDKMDGSLGILFNYKNEWILSTRGSFTSEQAIRGLQILNSKYTLRSFEPSVAYIVEILYPENRIVVNYDEERIVFLGAVKNYHWNTHSPDQDKNKSELHWTSAKAIFKASGIKEKDIVKTEQVFNGLGDDLYKALKSRNINNEEGYVLRFHPSNFRVKIKFEEYCRLHSLLTQFSSYDIWRSLMETNMIPEELIKEVPDEFYDWINNMVDTLREEFKYKLEMHEAYWHAITHGRELTQKEFALIVNSIKHPGVNRGILFQLAKGNDVTQLIWKECKPEYSKPCTDK